jgi:hypothetical protein
LPRKHLARLRQNLRSAKQGSNSISNDIDDGGAVGDDIVVARDHFVHIPAFSIAASCLVARSAALSSFVESADDG